MRDQTLTDHAALLQCTIPPEPARAPITQRILVPTDGSPAAGSAIHMAALLAEHTGANVEAATVFPALPLYAAGFTLDADAWRTDPVLTNSLIDRIRRQVHGAGGERWPLHVEFGSPSAEIAGIAERSGATLVVIGLGHHGALTRALGADTALRVVRNLELPVLAVHHRVHRLPRIAVVAADLGPTDYAAASAALAVMGRPATLHLVHVRPELDVVPRDAASWADSYTSAVADALATLATRLRADDVTVEVRVATGVVAAAVTAAAHQLRATLIAAGRRASHALPRLLMGSSVTAILQQATCSVLVVPPAAES